MICTPRRALLVSLVSVLVPLSLCQTIWRLSIGTETPQVINGVLVLTPAAWPEIAVTALLWTWALTAGMFVLGRGAPRPLRQALPVLPTAFGALLVAGAVVVRAFFCWVLSYRLTRRCSVRSPSASPCLSRRSWSGWRSWFRSRSSTTLAA